MTTVNTQPAQRTYHAHAYQFVFSALRFVQEKLGRDGAQDESGHISGRELLEGFRVLGQQHFGLMAIPVFGYWGVVCTDDIGRIVFELIETGEMRKNDNDQITDFYSVFDFEKAFRDDYCVDVNAAFRER